jgi:hypothetical protein
MQTQSTAEIIGDFVAMLHTIGFDETKVEYESDKNCPGRTAIRISGPTKVAVQAQIDIATRQAEDMTGRAMFIGPARIDGGFGALGEIVVETVTGGA